MKKVFSLLLICLLLAGCTSSAFQDISSAISSDLTASSLPSSDQPQSSGKLPQNQSSSETSILPAKTNTETSESGLWIRFLDVGQADSALVMCGGKYMLIDGGNVADSSFIYSCLKAEGVQTLDYIVCTHGHEDHVGGLSGALNACGVKTVLSSCSSYDSDVFRDFVKYVEKVAAQITIPTVGSEYTLGDANFTILSLSKCYENENNNSIVLRLTYGETSFLFMGDAEREAELDILDGGFALVSTLIKIGHHGSESSTSYVFLREAMPQYAVISVGKNNSYAHPDEAVLSRLRDADVTVYRTDQSGDILVKSDGKTLTVTSVKSAVSPVASSASSSSETTVVNAGQDVFIGNKNTKKVHLPSCAYLPDEQNRVYFQTYQEVVAAGYSPCQKCHPEK